MARMDAGPEGFLISGNRMTGAAVWLSPDAAKFEILEGAPALASDATGETWAFDGTATPDGWLVVGGLLPERPHRPGPDGLASADGAAWVRVPAAGASAAYEELQRVVVRDGVPVAVGLPGRPSARGGWSGAVAAGRVVRDGAAGAGRRWGAGGGRGRLFA